MRVLAIAIAGLTLLSVSHTQAAPNQARSIGTTAASAAGDDRLLRSQTAQEASQKAGSDPIATIEFLAIRSQTHQAERAQIACPRSGCQPVPRGCLREPERTFGGEPTGFDRIACPMR